jgi:hypothetical protein
VGKESYLRVPITMPEDMFSFLEASSLKAKTTGGRKLANTEIVRAAIAAMMALDVDFSGVGGEEELKSRIMEARAQYR